jgi:hypothetical protein
MPSARNSNALQIVDPVLTTIARQYRPEGFIYGEVFPSIPVQLRSGQYPVFTGFFGDDADSSEQPIDDRSPTPEVDFGWSTDTYLIQDFRLKVSMTRTEKAQAAANGGALHFEESKVNYLRDRMATRREVRAAAALRHTDNGGQLTGGKATPSNKWGTDAATIESDVNTGALAVRAKIGRVTNTMVLDLAVAMAVASQQDIREIVKYTVPGERILAGGAQLPPVLFGHRPLIADVTRNTGKKGATESLATVWSDHVRLLYLAANGGGWGVPSVGYSFSGLIDGAPAPEPDAMGATEVVDRYETDDPPVEYIRAWEAKDEKVVAPDAGYELYDVIA